MEMTFGERLRAARLRAGYKTQEALGDVVGVSGRTIRNYEIGKTRPDVATLDKLREAVGDLAGGDPVEAAVRTSSLVEWRQDDTIAHYKRHLYEQAREEAG